MRTALITGITGQDGSYLAEQLLERGYRVVGLFRRLSSDNRWRIRHLAGRLELRCVDLLDTGSLIRVLADVRPDEVYNLAAQSFVPTSWEQPLLTAEVTGLGAVRLLESVRIAHPSARVYQASTSEMYGAAQGPAQDEDTRFLPRSPYACAKLYAHRMSVNYREAYGMFVCCGILFNHESPRRGPEFVTRKVAIGVARIHLGLQDTLKMGALTPKRDWGFAGDYTRAMQLMLDRDTPEEFVVGTGDARFVQELLSAAFSVVSRDWQDHVHQDASLVRPNEVAFLQADPTRAREKLGWTPEVDFEGLVEMMVEAEIARMKRGETSGLSVPTALVTGGSGFLGRHLVSALRSAGWTAAAPTRAELDLSDPEQTRRVALAVAPELAFHCGAYTDPVLAEREPARCRAVNIEGTAALAAALAALGSRMILVSTCHVYGMPKILPVPESHPTIPRGVYATSKLEAERVARLHAAAGPRGEGLAPVVVRPFNLTGPGQGIAAAPSDWALKAARGAPEILVGDLNAERDYLDVRDAAAGIVLLAQRGALGQIYNLATGVPTPMSQILALAAPGIPHRQDPARLRVSAVPVLTGDASRARALGWAPTIPLERSLADLRAAHAARR